jgi:outer membrane lipoprotein-sorting protein
MKMKSLFLSFPFILPSVCLAARTASEIVDRANQLLRGQSSHALISMHIQTPKWERTLKIESWNQGRDKALMRIHAPTKERGNGTLKIGKELWNWLQTVERVIKIPPSMMHASWMGSDFTYEDVVKADSIVKDYTHEIVSQKTEGNATLYRIEALPKPDAPVVWGRVMLEALVEGESVFPMQEEDYSQRGERIRTIIFSQIKEMHGQRIPTQVTCLPHKKPNNKTTIIYHDFKVNLSFEKDYFSLKTLQAPLK